MSGIFVCPHCGSDFVDADRSVRCAEGHAFDRAKEGYLNLLVGGRLSSGAVSGDTPESLACRRRFLSSGAYRQVADELIDALGEVDGAVLDVGCGEGWYTAQVRAMHTYGLDISKRAVQMASKSMPDAEFVVGTAYRLPVRAESCAAVFTVFAPHSTEEYVRVLRPGGRWVTVTPAADHLREMRPLQNEAIAERERRRETAPDHAETATRVRFALELSDEQASDLFSMTPLVWQTAAEAAPVTNVTVDVWVSSGHKP